jgi:hypothetical protein
MEVANFSEMFYIYTQIIQRKKLEDNNIHRYLYPEDAVSMYFRNVCNYQTTRRHIPDDNNIQRHFMLVALQSTFFFFSTILRFTKQRISKLPTLRVTTRFLRTNHACSLCSSAARYFRILPTLCLKLSASTSWCVSITETYFHCQVLSSVKPVSNSNLACFTTFVAPSCLYGYTQRNISLVGSCNISQSLDRRNKKQTEVNPSEHEFILVNI